MPSWLCRSLCAEMDGMDIKCMVTEWKSRGSLTSEGRRRKTYLIYSDGTWLMKMVRGEDCVVWARAVQTPTNRIVTDAEREDGDVDLSR